MNWQIDSAIVTDRGCVRDSNEDAGRIIEPGDSDTIRTRGTLAIVADGMGGHSAGEIASALAVDAINRAYYSGDTRPGDSGAGDVSPGDALVAAIARANADIFARASSDAALNGMGTTCVALAICDGRAYAAHVGDSRLYLIRQGSIYQMTNDDSAVGEMVNRGVISREAARHHHEKNVILKALGTHASVTASTWPKPLPVSAGDVFLLCSDGLTDLVDDEELANAMTDSDATVGVRRLVALAKSRGGFDNITVAVLRINERNAALISPRETREIQVHP